MVRVVYIIVGCPGFGGKWVVREFSLESYTCTVSCG